MSTTMNHKPRKQLSDQLDRLDGIIDVLADGLNQAVADAARDGARAAVREILTELLADPTIQSLVRGAAAPTTAETAPVDSQPSRLARMFAAVRKAIHTTTTAVRTSVVAVANTVTSTAIRAVTTATHIRTMLAAATLLANRTSPMTTAVFGLMVGSALGLLAHTGPVIVLIVAAIGVLTWPVIRRGSCGLRWILDSIPTLRFRFV